MKSLLSPWIRIFISVFFIGLLIFFMRNNIDNLLIYLRQTKLVYFLTAVFLFLLIIFTLSARLKKIMEFQGLILPLNNVIYLSLIGFFFNNFLPTSVAGDFVKAYYTARYTNRTMESYTSIIVDRIFGIFAFIFIAGVALFLADRSIKTPLITKSITALVIVSIFLIILFSNEFIINRLHKFLDRRKAVELSKTIRIFFKTVVRYRNNFGIILFAFYTSFISQIVSILVVATLAKGLATDVSFVLLFLTLPIITVVSMLPSINGLGIREGAYVVLLGSYLGKEKALAISILWLGVIISVSLLGGIVYMFRNTLLKETKDNNG